MSDTRPSAASGRPEAGTRLLSLERAFLFAVALEVAVAAAVLVNWASLMPDPEPEPMKMEFVKLPEPPPPPPPPPPQPPKPQPKKPPPPKPPEPPKPEDKPALPEPKPPEPEPPPPPPPKEEPPPDLPPPDKKAPPVKKVVAHYPKDALSQGIEGRVRVRLTVSPAGKVLKTAVIESSPPGIFDYSAEFAAKKYIFPPGDETFEIDQVIVYKIEDDRYGPEAARPK
jgi:protein TonB